MAKGAQFRAQLANLGLAPFLPSFVSFCTFQIVKYRLRSGTDETPPPFALSPPKRKTNASRHGVKSERGKGLFPFPFYSILSLSRHSGIRSSLPASLAVGVKKSSRRLVSCQNNTSRQRQTDRQSSCQSLRAGGCGSLPRQEALNTI